MNLPYIDSHIHFWDPDRLRYDWLAGLPRINKLFLPADLEQQAGDLRLEGIVFVQADCIAEQGLREAEWVSELAQDEPRIQGIVAFASLEKGAAASKDWLRSLAKLPLVKGVRRLIQSEGPGFALQPDFVAAVQTLPEFGFSFDICIKHYQLGDALALVEQCPNVSFVLDHLGKPNAKEHVLDPWREQITALAAFPNVSCKLSGLVTEADHQHWTREGIRPYIDHIVNAFGPDRIMYGGDWPVSLLATTYRNWIETLVWATAGLSDAEQHKLFYQNAQDFYRLERG